MSERTDGGQYYPQQNPRYRIYGGSVYGEPPLKTLQAIRDIRNGGQVLEIGSGDGRVTIPMLREGYHVVAGENDRRARRVLRGKCYIEDLRVITQIAFDTTKTPREILSSVRQRPRIKAIKMNALNSFPFENGKFDGVVCTALLHVFPEETIQRVVDESQRVLKPHGEGTIVFDLLTNRRVIRYDGSEERAETPVSYTPSEGKKLIKSILSGKFSEPKIVDEDVDAYRAHLGHRLTAKRITVSAQTT